MENTFTKEQIYSDVNRILSQVADLESGSFDFLRNPEKLSTVTGFVRQIRPYVAGIRSYKNLSYHPGSGDSNFFYRDNWHGTYFFKERTDENGDCHGLELCYESQDIFTVRYNGSNGRLESFSIAKWPTARVYTYRRELDGRETYRFQWQNVNGNLLGL